MSIGTSYVIAFGGGVASFVSPCVLPVVPAYLSMITGLDLSESELGANRQLARVARDTLLFILGFGVVFVLLGVSATSIGGALFRNHLELTRVSGAVVVAMALFLVASMTVKAPFLYREARFHPSASRFGPLAAPIAGAAFGFGWTPCIGPVLATVLAAAATERGVGRGAALLAVYAAGLGIPFLVVGLGLSRVAGALRFVRRHSRAITIGSATLLGAFGVLLIFNRLTWVTSEMIEAMKAIGLGRWTTVG